MFRLTYLKSRPFLIYTLSPVYRKRSTTGVTSGAGTVYLSGAHEFTPVVVGFFICGVGVLQYVAFCVVFYR
jgi:hypothetical protein